MIEKDFPEVFQVILARQIMFRFLVIGGEAEYNSFCYSFDTLNEFSNFTPSEPDERTLLDLKHEGDYFAEVIVIDLRANSSPCHST
jgi:hypothetical protein